MDIDKFLEGVDYPLLEDESVAEEEIELYMKEYQWELTSFIFGMMNKVKKEDM